VGEEQLAELLLRRGILPEAGDRLRASVRVLEALGEAGASTLDWRVDLGRVRGGMARMWVEAGDPERALQEVDAARNLLVDSALAATERERAQAEVELVAGRALQLLGQSAEARIAWEEALRLLDPIAEEPGGGDFRVLRLEALMLLGRRQEADSALGLLKAQGLGEPWILDEARALGLSIPPDG
jgi:tetratricopeptide (TPR) repeat protein